MNIELVVNNLKAVIADSDPQRQACGLALAIHEIATWLDWHADISKEWQETKPGDELNQIAYQDEIESWGIDEFQALIAHGYDVSTWQES